MRLARVICCIIAGFLASALLAEATLRVLPVTMGLYRTQNHNAWPLHAYGPHQTFSYSMTWQMQHPNRGTTNNYGHLAPFDYIPGSKPVVVIGDSFIEAMMNRPEDTLQGELGKILVPKLPVYGLGFSGNSLAEYLAVARMAKSEFAPVAMVFLIIDNDIKESWSNRTGHHYFQIDQGKVREAYLPLDTIGLAQHIRQTIGDSALYRYVQVNLGFNLDGVIARRTHVPKESTQTPSTPSPIEQLSQTAAEYFLTTLPEAAGIPAEQLVLVFDSDRERVYDPSRTPHRGTDSPEIQALFKDRAAALGFRIVDTGPLFAAHYRLHRRKFDYTPTDRHWNGLAHRVVAGEVCRMLALRTKLPTSGPLSAGAKRANVGQCLEGNEGITYNRPVTRTN